MNANCFIHINNYINIAIKVSIFIIFKWVFFMSMSPKIKKWAIKFSTVTIKNANITYSENGISLPLQSILLIMAIS